MEKLLIFLAAVTMTIGCGKEVDDAILRINYVYLNQCSSEITVHSFSPDPYGEVRDSLFTIPQGKTHTLAFYSDGASGLGGDPLQWYAASFYKLDYVTISNGEKVVTQRIVDNGDLYMKDSYILIFEEAYGKIYERNVLYVFTDEFFENGEPIE